MNAHRRIPLLVPLLAALVAAVLAGAGCGGDEAPEVARLPTTATATTTGAGDARGENVPGIRYARCLREHGVDVADPGPEGNVVIEMPDTARAVVERAQWACQEFLPAGHQLDPEERDRTLAAMTKFTRCMRAEGIPMADPFTGPAGGVGFRVPAGVNPLSQKYRSAEAACKHHLPGRA